LIANLAHLCRERPEQELTHPHVVDQLAVVIDNVNEV
jgi:hypothetical protein